jgi:glycosyltransferase involved in cell wall biosynthesis
MIHLYCHYFGYQGVQQHGHYFCDALNRYHPVALRSWDNIPARYRLKNSTQAMLANLNTFKKRICSIGVGPFEAMAEIEGKYKIAFLAWETSRIPQEKLLPLKDIDEIWVPSAWGKLLFENNGIAPSRVKVIPEGVDVDTFKPLHQENNLQPNKPFRFLSVGKWEVRKGFDRLLQAWAKAFSKNDNVELFLHCHNPFVRNFDLRKVLQQADIKSAPVIVSDPLENTDDMVALYNSCDAFVLPTRAEGWGLPIIEAMACEKPVIVTDYSAHTVYANEDNVYLIRVKRMMRVHDPLFYNSDLDFGEWADPDVDHLIQLLRHVVDNPDEARRKARQARRDVSKQWTWDHAAQKALQRVDTITQTTNAD